MSDSYELGRMEPKSFEHLVNLLGLKVLGAGHTGFGPGADGGRDGYFEGEAPYPSDVEHWTGVWYIQSKFHKPNLSSNHHKWLIQQVKDEIDAFTDPDSDREWPDNWIVATNIDPSGVPETGAFDQIKALVKAARPSLENKFHIWGGRKILDLLTLYPTVVEYYSHFLSPGNVLTAIYQHVQDEQANAATILQYLIVSQLKDQQYTKLSQAGSRTDSRPGIHQLFVDLPFESEKNGLTGTLINHLARASARCHRIGDALDQTGNWSEWGKHPSRGRVWVIKGGPGQGKSTVSQFFSQVQRAALLLQPNDLRYPPLLTELAENIRAVAKEKGCWPETPRVPILIELKDYAFWFGSRAANQATGILTYLAERITQHVEQAVTVGLLRRIFARQAWFIAFDGLDEVPNDVKDSVSEKIRRFIDDEVISINADLLAICTSRPQGYSGQFSNMDGPEVRLQSLSPELALACASPVLSIDRTEDEAKKAFDILADATHSGSVRELMTTPLQSHIMAVVVRDGGRPPERRWQLFNNFYQVMKQREANKNFPDARLSRLLREDQLLKAVHSRLGFVLHARAETSEGALTNLSRDEFRSLVTQTVSQLIEYEIEETIHTVMEATTERLVLVSTPDDGNHVRFDIRQLQEFFAGEFLYQNVEVTTLHKRLEAIAGDAHWREVVYFLLSALIEGGRTTELAVMVATLDKLNDGDSESNFSQIYHRRMAKGALLVSRLLHEGVLEQNMQIRKQFGKCLTPLLALTDFEIIEPLTEASRTNTKSWLIDFMFNALNQSSESENIGALIVLAKLLTDNDSRVPAAKRCLKDRPPEYKEFFYKTLTPKLFLTRRRTKRQKDHYPDWILMSILDELLSNKSKLLSPEALRQAIRILTAKNERVLELAKSEFSLGILEIFSLETLLINDEYIHDNESDPIPLKPMHDYGLVQAEEIEFSWMNPAHNFAIPAGAFSSPPKRGHGLLDISVFILWFVETRTIEALKGLGHVLADYPREVLPTTLTAYIPGFSWFKDCCTAEFLKNISKDQFDELTNQHTVLGKPVATPLDGWRITDRSANIPDFLRLVEDYPQLAHTFWSEAGPWSSGVDIITNDPNAGLAIVKRFINDPTSFNASPWIWGKLIAATPELEEDIRIALLASIKTSDHISERRDFTQLPPFLFRLPQEKLLLAPFTKSIVTTLWSRLLSFERQRYQKLNGKILDWVISCIPDVACLVQIMEDDSETNDIRAGSLVLWLLTQVAAGTSAQFGLELKKISPLFEKLHNPLNASWFEGGIAWAIGEVLEESCDVATNEIGHLFSICNHSYKGRERLEYLLKIWREVSSAPLQNGKLETDWLSQTYY